jgi:hypothetical protein
MPSLISGFHSDRYMYAKTEAAEETTEDDETDLVGTARELLGRCTVDYVQHLHVNGAFAIHACAW